MDQILPWEEDAVASGVLILLGLLDARAGFAPPVMTGLRRAPLDFHLLFFPIAQPTSVFL